MQRTKTLLAALFLGIAFAPHSGATVYPSDGSEANVQSLGKVASDGDVITLPAGTFTWNTGVSLTKGVTISGQTTITGAGTANCTADDQTIIIDEKPRKTPMRERNFQRKQEFRARRDVTVKTPTTRPTSTTPATARERNSSVNRNRNLAVNHGSLLKATIPAGKSFRLTGITFKNSPNLTTRGGDGAIQVGSTGGLVTNAGIDCSFGGRYVARHNYWENAIPNGHGTEGWCVRGMRAVQIYNNVFFWDRPFGGSQRSGSSQWHDNIWLGPGRSRNNTHTSLSYFRVYAAAGGKIDEWWGANGENGWDKNDPHGLYFSGTAASNTTIHGGGTFTIDTIMTPDAYKGMQIRNDHLGAPCYQRSAAILSNTATTITYYYYGSGDRGPPLLFNSGDQFSIRNVLIGLDQNGRGKGDLLTGQKQPRFWPNQQQETCFSWNNKNTDTGQVLKYGNNVVPTQHEGSDYVNLGAGLPLNQIPAQVTAAYPADVNGGSAYTHEYTYPHPLVTGGPSPTPHPQL